MNTKASIQVAYLNILCANFGPRRADLDGPEFDLGGGTDGQDEVWVGEAVVEHGTTTSTIIPE